MNFVLFLQNVREATNGVFDTFMLQVTALGQPLAVFLVLSFIYWCVDKKCGGAMGLILSGGLTVSHGRIVFPCTHTVRATSVWGSLGFKNLLDKSESKDKRFDLRKRKILAVIFLLILLSIMISRCYFGIYSFRDVFKSFLITVFIMAVVIISFRYVVFCGKESEKKLHIKREVIISVLAILFFVFAVIKTGFGAGPGLFVGFSLGMVLDKFSIKFKTGGDLPVKIIRFIPGGFFVFFFCTSGEVLMDLLIPSPYDDFVWAFILSFFISFIYPMVFTIWESKTISEKARKIGKAIVIGICTLFLLCGAVVVGIAVSLHQSTMDVIEMARFIIDGDEIFWKQTGGETVREEEPGIEIIAHRGYSGIAPENTIAAFKRAVDIGADQIELDVQMTKDGVILVFHDNTLNRITGVTGKIKNYNYSEICMLDAGSWFDGVAGSRKGTFSDQMIPKLSDVCELLKDTRTGINLELKNIGDVEGFTENVVNIVKEYNMEDRVIFSSYNYKYLQEIKAMDEELQIEFISDTGHAVDLLANYPAEYYNLKLSGIEEDTAEILHAAGCKFYAWTLNDADSIRAAIDLGADGIVTNYPGLAKVIVNDEYSFLYEFYKQSYEVPVLYDYTLQECYNDYIMQGLTKIGNELVISAYDLSAHNNTVLYVIGKNGKLSRIVNLGMECHAAGIGYDSAHNLLWVTGSDGYLYAYDWTELQNGNTEPYYSFFAGFYNQNGDVIVSFLTVDDGKLFVGANLDGVSGQVKVYDITYPTGEHLLSIIDIPDHIQGITFEHDSMGRNRIIMTQSVQGEDSKLLIFGYSESVISYSAENAVEYILPEGAEQPFMTSDGLYLIFNSSARPYRREVRVPNDRIWLLK